MITIKNKPIDISSSCTTIINGNLVVKKDSKFCSCLNVSKKIKASVGEFCEVCTNKIKIGDISIQSGQTNSENEENYCIELPAVKGDVGDVLQLTGIINNNCCELKWVDLPLGPKGLTGPKGATGADGKDATGEQGPTGATGTDGADGNVILCPTYTGSIELKENPPIMICGSFSTISLNNIGDIYVSQCPIDGESLKYNFGIKGSFIVQEQYIVVPDGVFNNICRHASFKSTYTLDLSSIFGSGWDRGTSIFYYRNCNLNINNDTTTAVISNLSLESTSFSTNSTVDLTFNVEYIANGLVVNVITTYYYELCLTIDQSVL